MKKAPFTQQEVDSLNNWQKLGYVHPFTCGNDSSHRPLLATTDGWICQDCDYTQDWAHEFMLKDISK